jgi:hypothetical protein
LWYAKLWDSPAGEERAMGTEQNWKELEKKVGEALKIRKRPVAVADALRSHQPQGSME